MTLHAVFATDNYPSDQQVEIESDVATLLGRLFVPSERPRAAVVLHPATAATGRFYHPFARWLAEQGIACLTYDYRDYGASGTGDPARSDATLVRWGVADQSAAQTWLERHSPPLRFGSSATPSAG